MSTDSRSRIVSFRLTEEEYESFRELCITAGVPSISALARTGLGLLLKEPAQKLSEGSLQTRVEKLERTVQMLLLEAKRQSGSETPEESSGS